MSHLEYCACSHPNDHHGKRCLHPVPRQISEEDRLLGVVADDGPCPCLSGIRVDLATFRVLTDLAAMAEQKLQLAVEHGQTMARMLAVLEHSAGLQSRLVDAGNGRARVEVKPKIVLVGG